MRSLALLCVWLSCSLLLAQTPVVTFAGETMRLRSASVTPSGGQFNVTLTMENDNADGGLPTSYRRWWHCQIGNLNPAGTTLVITIANAGYTDVILPVWAQSTNGTVFSAYTRCPLSAVPTQPSSTTHRFTLTTPAGVTAIRLAKYFPYTVTRKDAFVQSLVGQPRLRSLSVLGNSQQGRPIHRLVFTDGSVPDTNKQRIWIHSGIHPAETTSYFTCEGLVAWLLSGDPYAEVLLDRTILELVPMANPDGVALGNYRVNANSANLEDEWASPYASPEPEIVALRTAIASHMGTLAAPGSNPITVLLNLHSSHNVAYPFHFQHTANANWNPVTSNSGVIPIVNQIEGQWITRFRAASPFVARGSTQTSSAGAPTRPFVESMMHDRWSAQATWTGAPNFERPVMAITFEGTYGRAADTLTWNTEADYRQVGAEMGRALFDYLGLQLTASVTPIGSPCVSVALQGSLAPQGNAYVANLAIAGAPANALGFLVFGFANPTVPLPAPWQNCLLRASLDATVTVPINGLGLGQSQLGLPAWPGLRVFAQAVVADLTQPVPAVDTSNALELANDY
ncbi:MAG: hypothetical protein IPK26_13005 [Planctomycetes bacterium]|nr:hypothetical protein [Planctomycetota bacterium]